MVKGIKAEVFVEKVHSWWDSYNFQRSPSYRIANKLRALKVDLVICKKKKKRLWLSLSDLDSLEETRPLSDVENLEKERLTSELEKTTLSEEIYWRQKSQILYLKEGDRNTTFFQC